MTPKEFDSLVQKGHYLLILDNVVIDIERWIDYHPGGSFYLNNNIGKDITKFFNGGYLVDGNMGGKPAQGHKHSNAARLTVNSLAIARYGRLNPA